jgi:hypothetical protein
MVSFRSHGTVPFRSIPVFGSTKMRWNGTVNLFKISNLISNNLKLVVKLALV